MFVELKDFLENGITKFIEGKDNLHVLFATYNSVDRYENGPISTGKSGLTIQVQNGNLCYSRTTIGMAFASLAIPKLTQDHQIVRQLASDMNQEAQTAQAELYSHLEAGVPGNNTPLLAIIYGGLSAFDDAVTMAQNIKRDNPNTSVILTTCDCMLNEKESKLQPLLANQEIQEVVVTPFCGGRNMMREILETIMAKWSTPSTTST